MNDALMEKFYEMYPEKKEKPKVIKAENAEVSIKGNRTGFSLKDSFFEELKPLNANSYSVATSNTGIGITRSSLMDSAISAINNSTASEISRNPSSILTYDKNTGYNSFLQIAEKMKNGTAQVQSVSFSSGTDYSRKITFEVYDYGI